MTVALFIPCIVDQFYPEIGEAVVDVMEKLGVDFDYPEAQTCCGLPFYNMGKWEEARRPAEHFVDVFESFEAVVTPSSSCAAMVQHFFGNMYKGEPAMADRVKKLAGKTHELTSYIVNERGRTDLGAEFSGSVACHLSCHLREIGAGDEAARLIGEVKGAQPVALPRGEVCCGFGGAFSVKFPVLSGALGTTKCETFDECKADLVVTTDAGCMLHVNGILHRRGGARRVHHIAELLANRIPEGAEA